MEGTDCLFLAHASPDKPFVERLAQDFVRRGYPVWFDLRDLHLGDPLDENILTEVDGSAFILFAHSRHIDKAGYVPRELQRGLSSERTRGKRVFLPLKLDDTELPDDMQRVYADFTQGYHRGLETLESFLAVQELPRGHTPSHHLLIPVPFLNATDLDVEYAAAILEQLLPDDRGPLDIPIRTRQLQWPQYDEYAVMRREALDRIAGIREKRYDSRVEVSWANLRACIVSYEAMLADGLAMLMSNWRLKNSRIDWREINDYAREGDREEVIRSIADALWCFSHIIRTQLIELVNIARTKEPVDANFIHLFANRQRVLRLFDPVGGGSLYLQVRQSDGHWSQRIPFAGDDQKMVGPGSKKPLPGVFYWHHAPFAKTRLKAVARRAMQPGNSRLNWRHPDYLNAYLIPQLLWQHLHADVPITRDVSALRIGHQKPRKLIRD